MTDILTWFLIGIGSSFIISLYTWQFYKLFLNTQKLIKYKNIGKSITEGYKSLSIQQEVDKKLKEKKDKEDDKWEFNYYR